MRVAGLTHTGRERSRNEDSYLVKMGDNFSILAVADGMGGHVAGDVASAMAIGVFERYWEEVYPEKVPSPDSFAEVTENLFIKANNMIFEEAARDAGKLGMGTTLTVGLLCGRNLVIGHIGDSRAYLVSENALTPMTEDHSLVEQLIQTGRMSPEEAEGHPNRHILIRALGTSAGTKVDLIDAVLDEGAALLFCSDGLTSMLRDEEIHRTVREHDDPLPAARALIALANERGGCDNITVVYATDIGRRAV